MSSTKVHLNFAPQNYRTRRWIALTLYSLSLVLLVLLFFKGEQFKSLNHEVQLLKTRVDQIQVHEDELHLNLQKLANRPKQVSLQELQEEVLFFNHLISKKSFYWTQFLSDLEKQISRHIAIRQIQPSSDDSRVKISGTAKTLKTLTRLISDLQSTQHFDDVLLLNQKPDQQSLVKNAIRFTITFRYLGGQAKQIPETVSKTETPRKSG